jgi:uncharacterized protein (DUF58 family)
MSGLTRKLDRAFFRIPLDEGDVRLSQRRVYLLPSGRGIAVLATGLTMLLIGMNYGVSLAYLSAFLIAGYLVCALIAAFRNMVNIEVSFTNAEDAHAGDLATFHFALDSAQRDRYFVTLACAHDVIMLDRLRRGKTLARLRVPTTDRGEVAVGRVMIQSIAPTGLIRAFSYVHFDARALVYPALLHPAPPMPRGAPIGAQTAQVENRLATQSQTAISGDALDGVREYVTGDSLARVQWNAVARGHAWRSKLLATDLPNARILSWLQTAALGDVNQRLSALATWVHEAARRGEPFSLQLPQMEIPTAQSADHRVACLRALAKAQV